MAMAYKDSEPPANNLELYPPVKGNISMNGDQGDSVQQIVTAPSLILFILTSILHGFIHGIVIGSFKDVKELLLVMIFVIIYKIPLSIAVGVAIINTGRRCCNPIPILSGLLFVLSTPGGILCMMFLDNDVT